VLTSFVGSRFDEAADVAVQPDGKFIVAGKTTNTGEDDFALARYNPDGTLDTTFGDMGRVITDVRLDDVIKDITLQGDGKILAAGFSSNVITDGSLEFAFAVARYNPNGSLDASFGNKGVVTTRIGGNDFGQRVVVMPDGKIVVGGSTQGYGVNAPADFGLVRYTPAGALDPTFGTGGIVVSDIGGPADTPRDFVAVGSKILAVGDTSIGTVGSNVLLARYDPTGKLDPTFGVGGKTVVSTGNGEHVAGAALLASGNIIVAGNDANAFTLRRFTAGGKPDTAFGVAGVVRKDLTPSDQANRLVVLPGDKLLLGASVNTPGDPYEDSDRALLRFNADGSVDTTFAVNGIEADVRPGTQTIAGLAVRPDGSILVAGGGDGDFDVLRYLATGATDTTFGHGGLVTTDFQSAVLSRALDVAVQRDGKIVAVGTAETGVPGAFYNIAIARYLPGGALDPTFGVGGQVQAGGGEPTRVFVRPDGRMVVAFIGTDQHTRFVQLNANGKPDTAFGVNGVADPNVFAQRGGANILRLADGRLLIAGVGANAGPSALAVVRMTADGEFDATFGTAGVATADLGDFSPYSIAVAPDGSVVVGGANFASRTPPYTTRLALVRFRPTGELDTSFGNAGEAIVTNGPISNEAVAIGVQSDGAIVVASGTDTPAVHLSRFTPAGKLDATFGVSPGTTPLPFVPSRVVIEPYDTILVAGANTSGAALTVARFNSAGRPDTAFGTNGVATVTVPQYAVAGGLTLDNNNQIVIAGLGGGQFAVARLTSDVQSPFGDAPVALPGVIEVENFDRGADGISYHDTTAVNATGVYRPDTGVDLDTSKDTGGGYFLRSTVAGEWLEYRVNVPTSGPYNLDARVASFGAGGTFSVSVDGRDVTGPITVPDTGGWQNWRTITKAGVALTGGQHVLRLNMLTIGKSGITGNFNWLRLKPAVGKPGLSATYYDSETLSGTATKLTVGNVNFNWGTSAPLPTIAPDGTFSARFEGFLEAPVTGDYTLYTRADDGVRLWFEDQIVINDWTRHPATERSATVHLQAGKRYALRLEYYQAYGSASLQLSWSGASITKQVIPASALSRA
jgi:uncharacterized delta-60 repeat protein